MSEPQSGPAATRSILVESSGICMEFLIATPLGLLIASGAIGAIALHTSVAAVIVACAALAFGTAVLVSCAYSVSGTCSIALEDRIWVVTHVLWRWRWTWRFAASRIRSVFLYKPPPVFIMWPGSSGLHVRVFLDSEDRSVPIASGLHAGRETLDRIQAMLAEAK